MNTKYSATEVHLQKCIDVKLMMYNVKPMRAIIEGGEFSCLEPEWTEKELNVLAAIDEQILWCRDEIRKIKQESQLPILNFLGY